MTHKPRLGGFHSSAPGKLTSSPCRPRTERTAGGGSPEGRALGHTRVPDAFGLPAPSSPRGSRCTKSPGIQPGPCPPRVGGVAGGGRSGDPARRPGRPYSHLTDQLLPEGGAPPVRLLPRNVHTGPPAPTSRVPLGRRRRRHKRSARPKPGSPPQRPGHAGSGAGIVGNGVAHAGLWEMEFRPHEGRCSHWHLSQRPACLRGFRSHATLELFTSSNFFCSHSPRNNFLKLCILGP